MFDKIPKRSTAASDETVARIGPEDERIALRCNRRELQLVDSFVTSGEFRNRSELMRAALRDFLRERAMAALPSSGVTPGPSVDVTVSLRPDEAEMFRAYGQLIANGADLPDVVVQLLRRGEAELKVSELVERARQSVRGAAEKVADIRALERTAEDLARKGVVGR